MRHTDHPIYHVYIYRLDHRVKRRRAPRRSPSNLPSLQTTTTEYSSADMGANEPITRNRAAAFDERKLSRFPSFSSFEPSSNFIRITPSITATVLHLIGASESTPFFLFISRFPITNVCHSKQGFEPRNFFRAPPLSSPYISH